MQLPLEKRRRSKTDVERQKRIDKNTTKLPQNYYKKGYPNFGASQSTTTTIEGSFPEITMVVIEMGSVGVVVRCLVIILLFCQFAKLFEVATHPSVRIAFRFIGGFLAGPELLGDLGKIQFKIIGQKFYKPR